jgi:hypothetical protein
MTALFTPDPTIERIFAEAHWPARSNLRSAFKLDRRASERWSVEGTASVLTLGHDLGVVIELHNLDGAAWWLAGFSSAPLAVGSRVSVGFSDPSARPATATVARCEGFGEAQFRLALQFDGVSFT